MCKGVEIIDTYNHAMESIDEIQNWDELFLEKKENDKIMIIRKRSFIEDEMDKMYLFV